MDIRCEEIESLAYQGTCPGNLESVAQGVKTMSSLEKPSRRALVAWGLGSAGLPFVSQALVPMAGGQMKPNEIGARIGQTVPVPPGLQIFYRDEWFGAPWLKPEPALFLHGNSETSEIWYGWVPRMAQHFRLFLPDLPGFGRSTVPPILNGPWRIM